MEIRSRKSVTTIVSILALCGLCSCDALAPDFSDWEVRYPPSISLSVRSLEFTALVGGADPDSQIVHIKNVGGEPLTGLSASVTYQIGQPTGWLSAELKSTSAPTYMVVRATAGALQADTLSAAIFVSSSVDGVWRKSLPVSLVLSSP